MLVKIIFNSLILSIVKEETTLLKSLSSISLDKKSLKFHTLQKKQNFGNVSIKNSDLYIKTQWVKDSNYKFKEWTVISNFNRKFHNSINSHCISKAKQVSKSSLFMVLSVKENSWIVLHSKPSLQPNIWGILKLQTTLQSLILFMRLLDIFQCLLIKMLQNFHIRLVWSHLVHLMSKSPS